MIDTNCFDINDPMTASSAGDILLRGEKGFEIQETFSRIGSLQTSSIEFENSLQWICIQKEDDFLDFFFFGCISEEFILPKHIVTLRSSISIFLHFLWLLYDLY
jgi:hypothetical protein